MTQRELITAERLRELLDYDPNTGIFRWRKKPVGGMCKKASDIAGTPDRHGHIRIGIDQRRYGAHRLAWLYVTGAWPKRHIDHRDGVAHNNRFANLREATHQQNHFNEKLRSSNTSGFKGVHWHRGAKPWRASIWLNYKRIHLGYFQTREEAAAKYEEFAAAHHKEFYRDTRATH